MDIITQLQKSLEEIFLSKTEMKELKAKLAAEPLDNEKLQSVRAKIFELANARATATNYSLVLQWVKDVINLLANPVIEFNGVFFSPGETCRNSIIGQINNAQRQLKICVFTISDDQITRAIIQAHKRNVAIQIISDNEKSFDQGSDISLLAREGIPMKVDITTNHMHHKFMVTDEKSLLTGSYNWTSSAARFNHENVLITKERETVQSFLKEFDRLWLEMAVY
jgi:mitochondrial cardiolipin hydrolase